MNRKQRRLTKTQINDKKAINFRGASYTIDEAKDLAIKYQKVKNFEDAGDLYRLILAKDPAHTPSLNNYGLILYEQGYTDEAIQFYRRAIALKPDTFSSYHNIGDALVTKGNIEEAIAMFRKALEIKPNFPACLYSLVHSQKYQSPDHDDAKLIRGLLTQPQLSPKEKSDLCYSLGKIYDDCGLYDEAFSCYQQANHILNSMVRFSPDALRELTKNLINIFSKEFLAAGFPFGSDSGQPLFIVGMPRSGTTLVANILSNHRRVAAAGELTAMLECTANNLPELCGNIPYPQAAKQITPYIASRLIKYYQKRLKRGVDADATYIIDKHPINFRHLGIISMLFPKARIIHCKRHPLDICLSNYFQRFHLDCDYSFDLNSIACFYEEYTKIMGHWQQAFPAPILEVNYEEIISDTEQAARKMLKFLDLEWDQNCLAPHANPRPVKTASMWQVRQPIYNKSVERWQNYEKHLAPVKKALHIA